MAGSEADGPASEDARQVGPSVRDRTVKDIISGMRRRRGAQQMPSTVQRNKDRRKRRRRVAQGLPPEEDGEQTGGIQEAADAQPRVAEEREAENDAEKEAEKDAEKDDEEEGEEDEDVVAPQVTIDEDGNIVIDQSSLVVSAGTATNAELDRGAVTVENHAFSTHITSATYSKREAAMKWEPVETNQFYEALRKFGTDFSLMESSFPKRTRRQLKLKFKREEREFPEKVDKALNEPPLPLPTLKLAPTAPTTQNGREGAEPSKEVGADGAQVIDSDAEGTEKAALANDSSDSEDED